MSAFQKASELNVTAPDVSDAEIAQRLAQIAHTDSEMLVKDRKLVWSEARIGRLRLRAQPRGRTRSCVPAAGQPTMARQAGVR